MRNKADVLFYHNEVYSLPWVVFLVWMVGYPPYISLRKMKDDFKKAKKIIGQDVICVNGCCYGRGKSENKGDYVKKCGQSFWEFISGKPEFYKEIVEPLGYKAKERNDKFNAEYSKVVNKFGESFSSCYLKQDKSINWEKIVEFNSAIKQPPKTNTV